MSYPLRQLRPVVLILLSTFGIVASIAFRFASLPAASSYVLAGCIVVTLLSLAVDVVAGLRAGEFGLDFLAAVAMASALWFGENLAGAIVAVMYAGGQFLEAYAHHRADEGMSDLLAKIPRTARRLRRRSPPPSASAPSKRAFRPPTKWPSSRKSALADRC